MSVTLSVQDILDQHVVLETEGIDRLYLNGFRRHRGEAFASSALMDRST